MCIVASNKRNKTYDKLNAVVNAYLFHSFEDWYLIFTWDFEMISGKINFLFFWLA